MTPNEMPEVEMIGRLIAEAWHGHRDGRDDRRAVLGRERRERRPAAS